MNKYSFAFLPAVLLLLIAFLGHNIAFSQQAPASPRVSPGTAVQPSNEAARTAPTPSAPDKEDKTKDNKDAPTRPYKLGPEEKEKLLASVDEVLRFASQDTLLPIKHSVKKAVVSREEVEKYIGEKFESDVDRIRFERSELVLKKFGLLPRTFQLHDFLIKLLGEQVAGFYNEKSKTMNLLDWVEPEMQKPVMAHELTHALQDQSYDLEKMTRHEEEIEKRGLEDVNALIRNDEESSCRTAVMEGQAMIVLLDYALAPAGRSVADSPKFVEMMQADMKDSKGSPIFDSAPPLLQEELIFPYRQGMGFVKDLLVAGGKKLAFTGVLDRMPKTTREIMEPKEYLAGRRVPPLLLPDLGFLKKDYEAFDAGAVGELDVNILLKVYADAKVAERLSHDWRGGAYYAAGHKGAKPPDRNSTAHVGLYYISKWASDASAEDFAKIYAGALSQRYSGLERAADDPAKPGWAKYSSSDGLIFIQRTGNAVVVVESFDAESSDKLIQAGLAEIAKNNP